MDNNEKLKDQVVIENSDEQLNVEDIKEEKQESRVSHYIKAIFSGALDQILAVGLGLILFMISDLILGVLGYEIVMRNEMFLIMFIISNVLYYPISQEILKGQTVGQKLILR